MKSKITKNQIKEVLKKFFDFHFNQTEFLPTVKLAGDNWEGFFLKEKKEPSCLLCRPITNDIWFFDGQYFYNSEKMFSISIQEFKDFMSEYIEERYGIQVGIIM